MTGLRSSWLKNPALFGLVALVPAAFNVTPAMGRGLAIPLCTGDGAARSVTVPVPASDLPGGDQPGCCAKGCHTGSRKKGQGRQDLPAD
ncbi:hypothetical protein ACFOD9_14125 [Novosphingobium bradum]|uniref:Uncharacterized protein n=1 Tax=Novosphingobium bradum TaxID=1737444 RepID=A0ABV7IUZ8_9SPHN